VIFRPQGSTSSSNARNHAIMRSIPKRRLLLKMASAFREGKLFRATLNQVAAMFLMLKDPGVPLTAKAEVAAALLYFLNPLDLIPDMLPSGLVDDAALLGVTWKVIQRHITKEHREEGRSLVLRLLSRMNLTKEVPPAH
ncbi:MAG: DUF1232 domain-containing protein, partial [Fidelibacterota bacterium]